MSMPGNVWDHHIDMVTTWVLGLHATACSTCIKCKGQHGPQRKRLIARASRDRSIGADYCDFHQVSSICNFHQGRMASKPASRPFPNCFPHALSVSLCSRTSPKKRTSPIMPKQLTFTRPPEPPPRPPRPRPRPQQPQPPPLRPSWLAARDRQPWPWPRSTTCRARSRPPSWR